jgi:hypothetical protein
LIDQNPFNPQSWNLYGYGRNNPLVNTDPSGRCSQGDDGKYHDDAGEPCVDARSIKSVTVTEKAPKVRDLEAEARAELVSTKPFGVIRTRTETSQCLPSAQQTITAIANAAPTVCGGGGFVFAGREYEVGAVSYFHGYCQLREADALSMRKIREVPATVGNGAWAAT